MVSTANRSAASDLDFDAVLQDYLRRYKVLASYVPELIAIRCGLRPALQLAPESMGDVGGIREMLADFCGRAGLRSMEYRSQTGLKIIISRKKVGLPRSSAGFGRLFGYPECCLRVPPPERPFDRLRDFWRKPRPGFETNLFLRTTPFHLIKHLPCAPDCRATLAGARRLLKEIARIDPALAGSIRSFGRVPVLYTDVCGIGILFQGRCRGLRVRYRRRFFPYGPERFIGQSRYNRPEDAELFGRMADALSRGDEAVLGEGGLDVSRAGRLVASIRRPSHLAWSLLDFT